MGAIQEQLLNLLSTVLVVCVGVVTTYIAKYLKAKGIVAKLEGKKNIVGIVVKAVEQIYKETKGQEKFDLAKEQIVKMLNEKKIKISDDELTHIIESMVKEMKDSVKEEIAK